MERKQLIFWLVSSEQSSSCIVIWDTYVKWLITKVKSDWLRPISLYQLFFNLLQYCKSMCPNWSSLDIFMIRWWWTNSQWCNLTLVRRFWGTKMCPRVSKISRIYLFGCPTGQVTSWKANFENYSRYSLTKYCQFLSLW